MEENKEWRRPTAEELELVKRQTKITTDYIYAENKIYMILIGIGLVLSIFALKSVFSGYKDALSLLAFLSPIELIFAGVIISRLLKTRFMLKSSDEGTVWVRELVVDSKESFRSGRRQNDPSYVVRAHIIHSDESSENARRSYHIPDYIYVRLCEGTVFLDVRYDDDLSGNPFLIIEQIWIVEQ